MKPASRTPEGQPNECPICGNTVHIEPSTFPVQDCPCPHCGHLLWFDTPPRKSQDANLVANEATFRYAPFDRMERAKWLFVVIASTIVVRLDGLHLAGCAAWFTVLLLSSQKILPTLVRRASAYVESQRRFWLAVFLGWAIVSGLPLGLLLGAISAYASDWSTPAWLAGLIGLVLGPITAGVFGLLFAATAQAFVAVLLLVRGKF